MTDTLRYRSCVSVDDLQLNECTIRRLVATDGSATGCWGLWFLVAREDNGQPEVFRVSVTPHGQHQDSGPCGMTWGLNPIGGGTWQVSPSIDFRGVWHQTPKIVNVPDGEPWSDL